MEKLRPEQLREKANMLPLLPGVYIMLDEHGEVIYIGKAKALKNRVTSYFRGEHLPKVAAMVAHVADFNVIVVQSEFEALVLENSLIKLHKPKYNILLKDDKVGWFHGSPGRYLSETWHFRRYGSCFRGHEL